MPWTKTTEFFIKSRFTPTSVKRLSHYSTRDLFPGGLFYLAIAILLISFGLVVISRTVWDYDFWWHIATGRYIIETGHLPHADPFSFTSQLPENSNLYPLRERFILTQYWLAQILMFLSYRSFGPAGTIILRTFLLLGSLSLIYRWLKGRGTMPYITYLSLFLAACGLVRFFGDRPVLFTISFSVACFVMIDDYVQKRSRAFYLLPVLMLAWSNLHGGFILGDFIILVFMMTEGMKLSFGRSRFSNKEKGIFFLFLFLALGASGINPNGFVAFDIAFSNDYLPFYSGIQEYASPFFLYWNHLSHPEYVYFVALFLFVVILILRNKKFDLAHLIILMALAFESASAGRFTVYYIMIASLVLGNELDLWLKEHQDKVIVSKAHMNVAFSIIMLVSSVLYFWGVADSDSLDMRESRWSVPKRAADFIENNHIKGNMLNDMSTGGYLAWRLYPEVKNFIDTRALNYTVMREYSWMATTAESANAKSLSPGKTPLWKRLLEHYKINMIVFSPLDVYGDAIPLVFKLLDEPDWVPVSVDFMAIVFLRNVPENKQIIEKFRKTKDDVCNIIIMRAVRTAQLAKENPHYLASIGEVFLKMGKKEDAIKAFEYAHKRMPDNILIKEKLDKLLKERSEVKNE